MAGDFKRRDLIKVTAGAVMAVRQARAAERRFFTADEFALLEELTETIIPADEKSGGAKAAGVAEYIDARVSEAFEPAQRDDWRAALKLVDSIAGSMHGAPFVKCSPDQRIAVLTRMERDQPFFRTLKEHTVHAYYTSRIGLHDDLDYKGNTYQQGEYAGELPD
jgi:Gluconate 2-dehydrogenase subunit 3